MYAMFHFMKHTTIIFATIIISMCVIGMTVSYVITKTIQQQAPEAEQNSTNRSNGATNNSVNVVHNSNVTNSVNSDIEEIDTASLYAQEPTTTKVTTLKTDFCPTLLEYPETWTVVRPTETMDSIEMYNLRSEATVAFLQNIKDRGLVAQTATEDVSISIYQSTANYIGSISSTEKTLEKALYNTPVIEAQEVKKITIGGTAGFQFTTPSSDGSYTSYVAEVDGKVIAILNTQRSTGSESYVNAIAKIIESTNFTDCK